jgi:pyruvate formate lyase activating enzyme
MLKKARSRFELAGVDDPGWDIDPATLQAHRQSGELGYVHSWEVGSTMDGPGIRFVLFLTGCLLRCQYCHNPDSWHLHNGRPMTIDAMQAEIEKYARALKVAGGGITFSGGEPVVQLPFLRRLLSQCKGLGLHTALDTSGRLGARLTDDELEQVDLQVLDIKSGDPETYLRVTSQPLAPTLDYARRLSDLGRPMWVRFVLVPGLTDAVDNVDRLAEFVAGLDTVERVEVLRFHQMGAPKWEALGLPYRLTDTPAPSAELTERVREQFRSRGVTVY